MCLKGIKTNMLLLVNKHFCQEISTSSQNKNFTKHTSPATTIFSICRSNTQASLFNIIFLPILTPASSSYASSSSFLPPIMILFTSANYTLQTPTSILHQPSLSNSNQRHLDLFTKHHRQHPHTRPTSWTYNLCTCALWRAGSPGPIISSYLISAC